MSNTLAGASGATSVASKLPAVRLRDCFTEAHLTTLQTTECTCGQRVTSGWAINLIMQVFDYRDCHQQTKESGSFDASDKAARGSARGWRRANDEPMAVYICWRARGGFVGK